MTRHARNCTAGAVYTYHEKKKDAQASGYGTNTQRVGKDSIKDFDCCSLTLQPCRDPVITPDGYLFDKEAILEYIITKKNEYSRKLKEYEKQKKKEETELAEIAAAEKDSKLNSFIKTEKNIVSTPVTAFKSDTKNNDKPSVSNMTEGRDKHLPSFWIPSKTPEAKETTLKKPDKTIYCPISGKPLRVKDLINVKFKEVNDPDDKKPLVVKKSRYMCAVTHDVLSNSVPCAVIRTTGDVVTMECVEKIIKKDWLHPLTNEKLTEKDIIPMQRGGTGYSITNDKLQGKHERPVLQA
ncbi:nitric oxide synthase-interacting protein homolog [Schistocerca serialis cubense]|uniref:nitric oxide synthase-interacting protein homolog n=1 Tax=Schistocerca nitens TaxID=7011 RepID=UPI002117DA10|nr:nitric oxide synthase-interacting protein homolog [Schistocerca nitens]XP_049827993.1 nitric oxide synthase-interacting protein homolog [Schistocerca gregaria]XP_049960435.1 nitric oxide synthase-interacting protein homolog [Schistocerca serialis cubense]